MQPCTQEYVHSHCDIKPHREIKSPVKVSFLVYSFREGGVVISKIKLPEQTVQHNKTIANVLVE